MSEASLNSLCGPYAVLEGLYALHDELGSGGFGKVRLATHLLTGQKVAIKIIDKKSIGPDLPRVRTELEALRNLQHQNICRLFHDIETEEKFFLVMEYCSGGEMFDYIVKKARLEESEARHFFRQLVQAMAYIHHQGYAHRDLKPENLLLTEDLHLKVIDFGLCAKPDNLTNHLETCCGSPAYAAPELVKGTPYHGNAADVWSMGVLLYALVVGALPFEDDTMQGLYRKITKGTYTLPSTLTPCCQQLIQDMLQTEPCMRITMKQLLVNAWVNKKYTQPIKWNTIYDKNIVDEVVAMEMAHHWRTTFPEMISLIKEWRFDYLTATYFILLHRKRRQEPFALPGPKASPNDLTNVINSPTIHASLENDLDRSGLDDDDSSSGGDDERERDVRFKLPTNSDKNVSYACAMLTMPVVMTGRSPQQRIGRPPEGVPAMGTPAARERRRPTMDNIVIGFDGGTWSGKENKIRATSVRVKGPVKVEADGRPRSIYTTPQRTPLKNIFSPSSRQRTRSNDRSGTSSPGWEPDTHSSHERTPRSTTKTPRLRQRVFASLERKADKMINLLTPRKVRNDGPQVIKCENGMVNLSITSSSDPAQIREQMTKIFEQQQIKYELNGWKISGRQKDSMGHQLTFELEVVIVESLGMVGVRRKRLNGDAFLYKRVCESILQMAKI